MTVKGGNDYLIPRLLNDSRYHIDKYGRLFKDGTQCTCTNVYGYFVVRYKYKMLYVHRIVYAAKVGPLQIGKEINHKNGIKTDNSPENLELVTSGQNQRHCWAIGLRRAEDNNTARLTTEQALDIRQRLKEGETINDIADAFSVTRNIVENIKHGRTWMHE